MSESISSSPAASPDESNQGDEWFEEPRDVQAEMFILDPDNVRTELHTVRTGLTVNQANAMNAYSHEHGYGDVAVRWSDVAKILSEKRRSFKTATLPALGVVAVCAVVAWLRSKS